ncbi:MarR family transcriptional regulator [Mesorhizobium sp. B1-1-5]|uniref:MarR family transcriptional regulator n=1 Tax=Mesorhizobium sp. B1-1-5 TaxID=2589979 RepID=UPI0011283321|nr:MarR family transcriptional regulator [Mesorhizobium sp. B1-1-5]TPO02183.1 MarR family transcriptional regulator [Mesorhizobium sp. B1-1-5]
MARDTGRHVKGLFVKIANADLPYLDALPTDTARWAYVVITARYWRDGDHRNPMSMSARDLAGLLRCNKETASRVIRDLVEAGFLVTAREGAMRGKMSGRSSAYRATWLNVDEVPGTATFDYRAKNPTSGETGQERTEKPDVERAVETPTAKPPKANGRKGFEAANSDVFAAPPSGTYSLNPKYNTPEAPEKIWAAPSPVASAVVSALAVIDRSGRSAERILAEFELRKAQ